ncbi:tail fiber assembly protein [Escherichia coli]|uniref:tail fiber assembly protein n=1 Tax=Escherichia TaxID=561 RepID=UPI0002BC29D7|nr:MULTISPECIES: tail fiber assembly protein [Escherichia]EET2647923.1 tail fiber assembly protein [Escherichia coli]EFO1837023.1 tail fiber assembly protein [Escherichia coli]EFO2100522.1 tail fiber assembly protein [Escherichia coli]EIT7073705.1 tail fiber assembly protein [Escherichia coli]EKM0497114.1 tail fiber assembly protein [Escherichia coli]
MTEAKLNNEFIAVESGNITVFNFDIETREYLSSSVEFLAVGVGIPANSCIDMPGKSKKGLTICRTKDLTAWEYIADHRGETVYSTETGKKIAVTVLGDYPEKTTKLPPATPYDKWNGSAWVTDTEMQHEVDVETADQKKAELLAKAQLTINLWQTELQLGIISDEDKVRLITWMNYIKAVQLVDTSTAPDITWPRKPE